MLRSLWTQRSPSAGMDGSLRGGGTFGHGSGQNTKVWVGHRGLERADLVKETALVQMQRWGLRDTVECSTGLCSPETATGAQERQRPQVGAGCLCRDPAQRG